MLSLIAATTIHFVAPKRRRAHARITLAVRHTCPHRPRRRNRRVAATNSVCQPSHTTHTTHTRHITHAQLGHRVSPKDNQTVGSHKTRDQKRVLKINYLADGGHSGHGPLPAFLSFRPTQRPPIGRGFAIRWHPCSLKFLGHHHAMLVTLSQ